MSSIALAEIPYKINAAYKGFGPIDERWVGEFNYFAPDIILSAFIKITDAIKIAIEIKRKVLS